MQPRGAESCQAHSLGVTDRYVTHVAFLYTQPRFQSDPAQGTDSLRCQLLLVNSLMTAPFGFG